MLPATPQQQSWLVVGEENLLPASDGARVETLNFLTAALSAGCVSGLLLTSNEDVNTAAIADRVGAQALPVGVLRRRTGPLSQLSSKPYTAVSRPVDAALLQRTLMAMAANRPSAVVSYTARVAHVGAMAASLLGLPHVVRPHNLESVYYRELAAGTSGLRKWAYRAEAIKTRRYERQLEADPGIAALLDISWDDHLIRSRRATVRCEYLPPFQSPARPAAAGGADEMDASDVLFIGSLDSVQNVDGLSWFIREGWPSLRRMRPSTSMRIVGRRPVRAIESLVDATAGITLLADVPEVAPFLAASKVIVNPMRLGSGVNIKMVEALSHGSAVVSTSHGCRGLRLMAGRDVVVADDPDAFAAAIAELLDDEPHRRQIAAAGHRWAAAEFDAAGQLGIVRAAVAGTKPVDEEVGHVGRI